MLLLKMGLAQLFTIFPASTLFSLSSLGCLYKYITAFPMPDSFSLLWSSILRQRSSFNISCLIFKLGRDLSGMGASQSVITLNTFASTNAICRSAFLSWVMTAGNMAIFLIAGARASFRSLSSRAATLMSAINLAIASSLSLIRSISFFFLLFLMSTLFLSIIISKSLKPLPSVLSGDRLISSSLSDPGVAGLLGLAAACSLLPPSPSLSEMGGRAGAPPEAAFSPSSSESPPNASFTTFFFLLSISLSDLEPDLLLERDFDLDPDLDLDRETDRDLDLERDLLLDLEADWDPDLDLDLLLDLEADLEPDLLLLL